MDGKGRGPHPQGCACWRCTLASSLQETEYNLERHKQRKALPFQGSASTFSTSFRAGGDTPLQLEHLSSPGAVRHAAAMQGHVPTGAPTEFLTEQIAALQDGLAREAHARQQLESTVTAAMHSHTSRVDALSLRMDAVESSMREVVHKASTSLAAVRRWENRVEGHDRAVADRVDALERALADERTQRQDDKALTLEQERLSMATQREHGRELHALQQALDALQVRVSRGHDDLGSAIREAEASVEARLQATRVGVDQALLAHGQPRDGAGLTPEILSNAVEAAVTRLRAEDVAPVAEQVAYVDGRCQALESKLARALTRGDASPVLEGRLARVEELCHRLEKVAGECATAREELESRVSAHVGASVHEVRGACASTIAEATTAAVEEATAAAVAAQEEAMQRLAEPLVAETQAALDDVQGGLHAHIDKVAGSVETTQGDVGELQRLVRRLQLDLRTLEARVRTQPPPATSVSDTDSVILHESPPVVPGLGQPSARSLLSEHSSDDSIDFGDPRTPRGNQVVGRSPVGEEEEQVVVANVSPTVATRVVTVDDLALDDLSCLSDFDDLEFM